MVLAIITDELMYMNAEWMDSFKQN